VGRGGYCFMFLIFMFCSFVVSPPSKPFHTKHGIACRQSSCAQCCLAQFDCSDTFESKEFKFCVLCTLPHHPPVIKSVCSWNTAGLVAWREASQHSTYSMTDITSRQ